MAVYNTFKKISTRAVIDGEVENAKLADGAVGTTELASNAAQTVELNNGSVTTGKLDANLDISGKTVVYRAMVDGDFASGAISGSKLASAASVDNLGYTPVNRVGDTMSGQIIYDNANYVASSGATTSGLRFSSDNIEIRSGGNLKFQFDGSGRPLEADRPAWVASGNGGWRYANSYGGPGGWRELDNMSYQYSTSGGITTSNNSRVTAPVAGYYYVYLQSYWYNNNNNSNGYTHWNISKNSAIGSSTTGRVPHTIFSHGVRNNYTAGIMCGIVTYMNAGQYVSPQPYFGGNQGRHHGNHTQWCGYLIG